jgi:hypothetical protein
LPQAIFEPNRYPYKYPQKSHPCYSSCLHRLWRWNIVFRNVGI